MCLKLCLKHFQGGSVKALPPVKLHEQFTASSTLLCIWDDAQAFSKVLCPMYGIYVHMHGDICIYVDMHIYMYMYMYMCMSVCLCAYVCVKGVYVCVYVYVCIHVHICLHVCVYMYK